MIFVGLTNSPMRCRLDRGKPTDWIQRRFSSEPEARQWLAMMAAKEGLTTSESLHSDDWQFGYVYTITLATKEC